MNNLKRLKNKIFSGGGLLLALIYSSLIGVGFSSWIIEDSSIVDADVITTVGGISHLITYNSSSINGQISKYGFIDNNDQIVTSITNTYEYTLHQESARSGGYLKNGTLSLEFKILRINESNNFASLFYKSYYSAEIFVRYNSVNSSNFQLSSTLNTLTGSISLNNLTENATETIVVNLLLTFNVEKTDEYQTYLSTLDSSKSFDYTFEVSVVA